MSPCSARHLGLIACTTCGLVCRDRVVDTPRDCPRCASALHTRKPNSLARCWALLIAAALLYLPANLLPIMHTRTFLEERDDTILSGVRVLWQAGSWDLALIVFIASVFVPLAKLAVLAVLLFSVQRGWRGARRRRTRLYRWVDWIGAWSMLDIFVVVLLVALVQFQTLARVEPGLGAVAFGGVVVLTLLASHSFDPRLIWDAAEAARHDEH